MKHSLRASTLGVLILLCAYPVSAQEQPQLVAQTGNLDTILALAITPDNKYLASAGIGNNIIIWDLARRRKLYSLSGHSRWIYSLSFRSDGKLLASGSADGTVKLWNIYKGTKEADIGVGAPVNCVTFDPNGDTLAIATDKPAIKLWDLKSKSFKPELKGHVGAVKNVTFSPDGMSLISSGDDQDLRLWNLTKNEVERHFKHQARIQSLACSPAGKLVALGTIDDGIGIWDLSTSKLELRVNGKERSVDAVTFVSNTEIAYLANSKTLILDLKTQSEKTVDESKSGDGSYSITAGRDGDPLAFTGGNSIKLVDLKTTHTSELKGGFNIVSGVAFSSDTDCLFGSVAGELMTWGDEVGVDDQEVYSLMTKVAGTRVAYVSASNVFAFVPEIKGGYGGTDVTFIPVEKSGQTYPVLRAHAKSINSITALPNSDIFATSSEDNTVKFWKVGSSMAIRTLPEYAQKIAFSPNAKLFATQGRDNKLWNTATWRYKVIPAQFGNLLFSPDSAILGIISTNLLELFDTSTGKPLYSFSVNSTPKDFRPITSRMEGLTTTFAEIANIDRISLSFSNDSKLVAAEEHNNETGLYTVKIWSLKTGAEVYTLKGHVAAVPSTTFSSKGTVLASGSWDTTIKLWSTRSGHELATIVPLNKDDWIIYTPDGRFDTNIDLEDVDAFHWSMPGEPLTPLPLDLFIRDYFEPKLLERLIACSDLDNCNGIEFKEVRDLTNLNTSRPNVQIKSVSVPDAQGVVSISVEVSQGFEVRELNGKQITRHSGVYDLRVFRDRQMVGVYPTSSAEELWRKHIGSGNSEVELNQWRKASEIKLDSETGTRTLTFRSKVPGNKDLSSVVFSAYAFNEDRVKSPTTKYEWPLDQKTQLTTVKANTKPQAYIISVGINRSAIPKWNLNYGVADADGLQKVVPEKLRRVGSYDVIPIELVSGYRNGKPIDEATKNNIKAAIDLLAGREVPEETRRTIPAFQMIRKATPDDFVLLTISSHGYSARNGDFYLFPSDITQVDARQLIPDVESMISGEEMSIWLRDVDAGEIAIVIDACQSAAAVEALSFKPGPLGSRGLGQLAYDKRMMILTATRASDDALEADGINHGLLSYVLSDEGFSDLTAGEDGKISLKEWLQFGERRVPRLYKDVINGKLQGVFLKRNGKMLTKGDVNLSSSRQRASLFDFSHQNGDIVLAIVDAGKQKLDEKH